MAPTWKHGTDFAIRYGGRGNIAWFSNGELAELASAAASRLHPVQLILQAVEAAAAVVIALETRKQTAIIAAEFEERRLLWCSDLMVMLVTDVCERGVLQVDTTRMLERELRRTMSALDNTRRMELPYSFLLQCDRIARGLSPLNRIMYSELRRYSGRAGVDLAVPEYISHDQLRALLPHREEKSGVLEKIVKVLPVFRSGDDPLRDWMRATKKDPQLVYMENLALELRSAEGLLGVLQGLPDTTRDVTPQEEVADLDGLPKLVATLGLPLLPGVG